MHAEMLNINEECLLYLNHVCDLDALCPLRKERGTNPILMCTSVCIFKRMITFQFMCIKEREIVQSKEASFSESNTYLK